jgi:hypothetical protein
MIIDGKDTVTFPETPKIGEEFKLTGLRDDVAKAGKHVFPPRNKCIFYVYSAGLCF